MSDFEHYSVMLDECIEGLNISDGVYVDCTAGGGGHSLAIVSKIGQGRLIAVDQDATAIDAAKKRLRDYSDKTVFVNRNFVEIGQALDDLEIQKIHGALIDLGVSSYQLDTPDRGFSYRYDAPLDMRMDENTVLSAYDVVNTYSEEDLINILFRYGEESFAPQIARSIVRRRAEKPIETTFDLVDAIKSSMPPKALCGGHHPAKKSFQAIRIEVNHELDVIEPTLRELTERLDAGGRLAVITFHSLEDRIVKQTFASLAQGCICPKTLPVCVCGHKPTVRLISRKPILPSPKELEENPRSRSAKLRIVEKL
ncbi:MAG: 16S rRNA (cytosine(1402)-N(4))-methyltransferase RsmH [Eubacteriales bacterium]